MSSRESLISETHLRLRRALVLIKLIIILTAVLHANLIPQALGEVLRRISVEHKGRISNLLLGENFRKGAH